MFAKIARLGNRLFSNNSKKTIKRIDPERRMRIAEWMVKESWEEEIRQMEAINAERGPCKVCGWLPFPAMDTGDYWDWDHDMLSDHPYLPLDK